MRRFEASAIRVRLLLFVLAASSLGVTCRASFHVRAEAYVRPRSSIRVTEPPPLREPAARPEKPDPRCVWVPGHWVWVNEWVWTPGEWKLPEPGFVWEPPVTVAEQGNFDYYPPYWRPPTEEPEEPYRRPGAIQVHIPSAEIDLPVDRVVLDPGTTVPTDTPGTPSVDVGLGPDAVAPDPIDPTGGTTPTIGQTLNCSLSLPQAPRGGTIVIRGAGFTDQASVRIGGTIAPVSSRELTSLEVQVPLDSSGGAVSVHRGEDVARCGTLEIVGG
ncbi:MAG: IPT/TIG domain-containing protein [Myxococcota bacterium]